MRSISIPFSTLLRHPNQVTAELEKAGLVRLTRRDQEDVVLVTADRHDAASDGVGTTAQLLGALVVEGVPSDTLRSAIARACPWTRFLPEDSLTEFVDEFVDTAVACAELGKFDPLTVLLHAWKSTAAIYADPVLSQALREPLHGDDFGQVEAPR